MSFSSTLRPRHVVTVMNQSFRANLPGPLRAVCAIVGLLAGIAQGGPLHERVASFDRPATTPFPHASNRPVKFREDFLSGFGLWWCLLSDDDG